MLSGVHDVHDVHAFLATRRGLFSKINDYIMHFMRIMHAPFAYRPRRGRS
jgi:hypothetical protein